jgi:glycosyltransferase involved in cell wall biosynthesis
MACGLPVISTAVGQVKSIVRNGENGILVDENNNVDEIVKHILSLKNGKGRAAEIGKQARKDIESYHNWSRVALETEDILKGLVNGAS